MVTKYKKKKSPVRRNLFFPMVLSAAMLLLIGILVNANLNLGEKRTELESKAAILESELDDLKEQKETLETQISWSAEDYYLEKVARDIRNLMREGERAVVIVPPSEEEPETQEEEEKSFWENILDWIK